MSNFGEKDPNKLLREAADRARRGDGGVLLGSPMVAPRTAHTTYFQSSHMNLLSRTQKNDKGEDVVVGYRYIITDPQENSQYIYDFETKEQLVEDANNLPDVGQVLTPDEPEEEIKH